MGLFTRWASNTTEINNFNLIMSETNSVEKAFVHAIFAKKANKSDLNAVFNLLNNRVIGKKMDLLLTKTGALSALDAFDINDCFTVLDAQLAFMKQYPGCVHNLLIHIPFSLDKQSEALLSAKLHDFFKKAPAGLKSFQLQLAQANTLPLSAAASQAILEATAKSRIDVKLINVKALSSINDQETDSLMGGFTQTTAPDPVLVLGHPNLRDSVGSLAGDNDEIYNHSPSNKSSTIK